MLRKSLYYLECATSACRRLSTSHDRFLRYMVSGVGSFLVDLFLVWLLTEVVGMYYLYSVITAFLIAVSINYAISRDWVFKGTARGVKKGYIYFVTIMVSGLVLTAGLMWVGVELLLLHYLFARVLVSGVVGIFNYLMNLYFNFRVAGTEIQ